MVVHRHQSSIAQTHLHAQTFSCQVNHEWSSNLGYQADFYQAVLNIGNLMTFWRLKEPVQVIAVAQNLFSLQAYKQIWQLSYQ